MGGVGGRAGGHANLHLLLSFQGQKAFTKQADKLKVTSLSYFHHFAVQSDRKVGTLSCLRKPRVTDARTQWQTHRQTDRQTRLTDRQADRRAGRGDSGFLQLFFVKVVALEIFGKWCRVNNKDSLRHVEESYSVKTHILFT